MREVVVALLCLLAVPAAFSQKVEKADKPGMGVDTAAAPVGATAEPPPPAAPPARAQVAFTASSEPLTNSEAAAEVSVLRAQLEMAREFQSDVLTTVYWSLGLSVGIAFLLVGYNWWTNNRTFEREKHALLQETRGKKTTQINEAVRSVREELTSERRRIDGAIETLSSDLRERVAESVSAEREARANATAAQNDVLLKLLDKYDERNQIRLSVVKVELARFRRMTAEEKEFWSLAVTLALQELEEAIVFGGERTMEEAMNAVCRAIDRGGLPSESEKQKTPTILEKVPEKFESLKRQTAEKVAAAEAFKEAE
jgi:hypothetical protein